MQNQWTQKEFAQKLGIGLRTYQRIEYGQQKPSYYVVIMLQDLFDEKIETILKNI